MRAVVAEGEGPVLGFIKPGYREPTSPRVALSFILTLSPIFPVHLPERFRKYDVQAVAAAQFGGAFGVESKCEVIVNIIVFKRQEEGNAFSIILDVNILKTNRRRNVFHRIGILDLGH